MFNSILRNQLAKLSRTKSVSKSELDFLFLSYKKEPEQNAFAQYDFYNTLFTLYISNGYKNEYLINEGIVAKTLHDDSWKFKDFSEEIGRYYQCDLENPVATNFDTFFRSSCGADNDRTRLKYLSHRLMLDTDFNSYSHFQGQDQSLANFFFLKDLQLFQKEHENSSKYLTDITSLILIIQSSIIVLQQISFLELINKLDDEFKLTKSYHLRKNARFDSLCFSVYKKLHKLKFGEKLLLPSGYGYYEVKNNIEGHASCVLFTCTGESKFNIEFIDTNYEYPLEDGELINAISFVENESLENIIKFKLVYDLLHSMVVVEHNSQKEAEDKYSKPIENYKKRKQLTWPKCIIKGQTNETCTHSCLEALAFTQLSKENYECFSSFVLSKAIIDMAEFRDDLNVFDDYKKDTELLLDNGIREGKNILLKNLRKGQFKF